MSRELELIYLLITVLVGVFSIGQCSIILIRFWGNRVVRSYLLFMGLISIKIFTWLILSYLQIFRRDLQGPYPLVMASELSIIISFWALPRFVHAYFKVPFAKKLNSIFLVVAVIFGISAISGIHIRIPIRWLFYDLAIFAYFYFAIIIYSAVIAFIYRKRLEDRMMREGGLVIGLVLAVFTPAFVVDFLYTQLVGHFTLLTPLFYITVNLLAFYYTIRYYLSNRKSSDTGGSEESHLPPEQFYSDYNISSREQEILLLLLKGHSNQEIADLAFISLSTVKTHIYNIYRKVEVKNRLQLTAKVRESCRRK